jgi:hypothetical protein
MEDKNKVVVPVAPVVVPVVDTVMDPITAKDEEISKLKEERDNYKNVALKRLGKLPGDANFIAGEKTELSVEEQVRLALLDKEIEKTQKEKDEKIRLMAKENSELKLALKNHPSQGLGGGDGGSSVTVKDNVFSEAQIADLTKRALRLKADPQKFIESAKKNFQR